MKKIYYSLFIILCLLLFSGCQQQGEQQAADEPQMSIQTAALSQEERRLLSLLNSSAYIFDYHLDHDLQSISISCYQLDEHSRWQQVSGGGKYNVKGPGGRMAIQFQNLADNLQIRFQSADGGVTGSGKSTAQQTPLPENMTLENIVASEQDIVYDQEIPLILQCQMPKNEYTAYQITDFAHPERFTQQGIRTVYALTIRFSRNQLGENLLPNQNEADTEEQPQNPASETSA